mmetsp:Transcript_39485/g.108782  ORF Transcript_39485/g.108782 Transcript_39485/m.108782 type:complete len:219 (-) Transcript_39485:420-1076(-)
MFMLRSGSRRPRGSSLVRNSRLRCQKHASEHSLVAPSSRSRLKTARRFGGAPRPCRRDCGISSGLNVRDSMHSTRSKTRRWPQRRNFAPPSRSSRGSSRPWSSPTGLFSRFTQLWEPLTSSARQGRAAVKLRAAFAASVDWMPRSRGRWLNAWNKGCRGPSLARQASAFTTRRGTSSHCNSQLSSARVPNPRSSTSATRKRCVDGCARCRKNSARSTS